MAKFYVNFAITVCVNTDKVDITRMEGVEAGTDISDLLSDDEWNDIVSEACDLMEIDGNNVDSIELVEEEDEDGGED